MYIITYHWASGILHSEELFLKFAKSLSSTWNGLQPELQFRQEDPSPDLVVYRFQSPEAPTSVICKSLSGGWV